MVDTLTAGNLWWHWIILFLFFLSYTLIFIYLAAPGLSCSTWDLCCHVQVLHCSMRDLLVMVHGIFSCGMWTLSCGMWDLVPWPGIKPEPPALGVWSLSHWTTREVPGLFSMSNPMLLSCKLGCHFLVLEKLLVNMKGLSLLTVRIVS